jgi:hypothetical protein
MAEGIFGAFTSAQKAGQQFGQDIQSKNILQEAYAGASPDVAADPKEQSTILQKASVLAGQKGLQSLAHSFQKDASSLSQDVQKSQIDSLKNMQTQLGYSGQLLSALPDNATTEDFNNVFANIKEPQAQLAIQSITRSALPPERKKELLTNLTKTVDQNLKAMQITALGEYRERSLDIREEGILLRARTAAGKQGNIKGSAEAPLGAIKRQSATLKDELGDVLVKDKSGALVPMSDAQRSTVASRIENEGRQRYKNNPENYSSRQDAVDEARDDIIAQDFSTKETKKTFLGIGVPFTGKEETVYKGSKEAAKPAEKKATKSTYTTEQESWITRAMQANPDMSREEIVKEGKKLKKL